MFWDTKAYINKKHQYSNNEIFVHYLNLGTANLDEWYDDLRHDVKRIFLECEMSDYRIREYDETVQGIQKIMNRIDDIRLSLPPYDVCLDANQNYREQLIHCLNRYSILFEDDSQDPYGTGRLYDDSNEYGYMSCDEKDNDKFWIIHFYPNDVLSAPEFVYKDRFAGPTYNLLLTHIFVGLRVCFEYNLFMRNCLMNFCIFAIRFWTSTNWRSNLMPT